MSTVRPIPAGTIRRRTGIIRTIRHPKQPTGLRVVFLGISVVSLIGAGPSLAARQEAGNRVVTLCDSAYAQLERGDTETALAGAAEAVELDPASARAHTCLGRVYLALPNRTHEAIECFQTALFMEPDHIETLYWKARAHLRLAPTDLGRFNSREALKNLERLLELDPSHPDAAYLCGVIYRDHYEQYERAIAAFRLQIEANPGHSEARIALLKIQIDTGDWAGAIATAETLLRRDPADHTVYPFLAAAHWKAGRGDEAMAVFDRYFGLIDEPERALYFNLGYILTPAEQREYAALDDAGRSAYWRNYWRSRDPDPKTMVNERLLEHFIRVAYARIEFSAAKWPWDGRGDLMIRFGEPDQRMGPGRPLPTEMIDEWEYYLNKCDLCDLLGLQRPIFIPDPGIPFAIGSTSFDPSVDGSGTPEVWVYVDRGFDVMFTNPVMSGNYLLEEGELLQAMKIHLPVFSEEEDRIETFDPLQSAVTFRGAEGRTALEYAVGLTPDDFGAFRSLTGVRADISISLELFTPDWQSAGEIGEMLHNQPILPQVHVRGIPMFVHGSWIEAAPGDYTVSILVMDPESGRRAVAEEKIALPDYTGTDLMMSDILPAARITEVGAGRTGRFVRNGFEIVPLPGRNTGTDEPLFVYFEVYNFTRDAYGATRYRIEYAVSEGSESEAPLLRLYQGIRSIFGGQTRAVLSSEFEQSGIQRDLATHLEIDMSHLPHGVYHLAVTVHDLIGGQEASSGLNFRTLPRPPSG